MRESFPGRVRPQAVRWMFQRIGLLAVIAGFSAFEARACDLCAVESSTRARGEDSSGFHGGIAEQFTHFGTLKTDGRTVGNENGQAMNSLISQFYFAYGLDERTELQLNLPLIYRTYRRMENGAVAAGSETGPGDLVLFVKRALYRERDEEGHVIVSALGGVKLPTGSTARLREELDETDAPEGTQPSGTHGHDLTLGSGSLDGLLGAQADFRWRRFMLLVTGQASLRTEGRYGYHFANDLHALIAPGYYLVLEHARTATLAFNLSGEFKGKDVFQGVPADDTGITSVFAGPQFGLTVGERLAASLALELPVVTNNTAFQLVPDSRVRASVSMQF